ncbi:uncharacterized protein EI90DRAFT_3129846 [Cantharellus anzutake]|uniref:uncharacterized protein n=1 Tax=Cantharellus anzutake TaxID=1750568 RepID=UPI00190525A7|nr:uncharacterized protein EI90DRAFT_3129846 [Cantharellus anzutake]KAF8324411.1 hypothetical protein EI90DRAFT_3129846 [Cantharellus anzutake]
MLTNPTTLPTMNMLMSYAVLSGGFLQMNGPQRFSKMLFSILCCPFPNQGASPSMTLMPSRPHGFGFHHVFLQSFKFLLLTMICQTLLNSTSAVQSKVDHSLPIQERSCSIPPIQERSTPVIESNHSTSIQKRSHSIPPVQEHSTPVVKSNHSTPIQEWSRSIPPIQERSTPVIESDHSTSIQERSHSIPPVQERSYMPTVQSNTVNCSSPTMPITHSKSVAVTFSTQETFHTAQSGQYGSPSKVSMAIQTMPEPTKAQPVPTDGQPESSKKPSSKKHKSDRSYHVPWKRKRISRPHIQQIKVTKEETAQFFLTEDAIDSWLDVGEVNMLLVDYEKLSPEPSAGSKLVYNVQLHVTGEDAPIAFQFPHYKDSASYNSFIGHGNPFLFNPGAFQEFLDYGNPVLFQVALCLDSDEDQQSEVVMRHAAHEMCQWETSQPLIIEHALGVGSHYQPVEKLLNTHEVGLADYSLEECPIKVKEWQGPMISSAGSVHPPHQNPNSISISICCKVIVDFNDVLDDKDVSCPLGYEYLYQPPHRFTSFILSAGQTVVFPPGQIYAYATISSDLSVSPGCYRNGFWGTQPEPFCSWTEVAA